MGLRGVEPLTSRLSGVRSNQLSYRPHSGRALKYNIRANRVNSPRLDFARRRILDFSHDRDYATEGIACGQALLASVALSIFPCQPRAILSHSHFGCAGGSPTPHKSESNGIAAASSHSSSSSFLNGIPCRWTATRPCVGQSASNPQNPPGRAVWAAGAKPVTRCSATGYDNVMEWSAGCFTCGRQLA
jgi:hypothetical protein